MRRVCFLMLFSFGMLLGSCSNPTTSENEETLKEEKESNYSTLKTEVMRIHDAVMPETSTIIAYTKTIRESMDTLSEEAKNRSKALIKDLKQADKAMMEWMRQYDDPESLGLSLDSATKYLQEQKIKIEKVDSLMRTSLKNAKAYIETID